MRSAREYFCKEKAGWGLLGGAGLKAGIATATSVRQKRRARGQFGHDRAACFRLHPAPGSDLVNRTQATDADPFGGMNGA